MKVLLSAGPADGRVVDGGGETVLHGACLYERAGEKATRGGQDLPVFRHRPDCCEPSQRGSVDGCE